MRSYRSFFFLGFSLLAAGRGNGRLVGVPDFKTWMYVCM